MADFEALQVVMAKTASASWAAGNGPDPAAWKKTATAANLASDAYRSAANSTGLFEVSQTKVMSQTQEYTKMLQKQKLTHADLSKSRLVSEAAYQEQLRLSQASLATFKRDAQGNILADVAVPRAVSKDLDTVGNRISWIAHETASASRQMVNWGKNTQWAGRQLMVGFTMPVAAFGAVAGTLAYQADKELTRITKVYNTKATEQAEIDKELGQVRSQSMDLARDAATKYGASLTETLDAESQLAATGMRGNNLMKATDQVMRISTLGELDYNDAVQASIALQSVFRLSTKQTAEAFDYMNAVENATSLTTQDFAQAIPIAAAPIKQMGGDVKLLGEFLAAMKERGIAATQGANAIKAAMQRLYRPSEQIRKEWQAITDTDLTEIRDSNKGNIKGMLADIADATDQLGRSDKIQVLGGLFGTYQVTRLNALIEGIHDMENGIGQAAKAAELGKASVEELAKIAEGELGQRGASAAGQFKSALEELKVSLADLGTIFLTVGTYFLKYAKNIIDFINNLPDAVKRFLAFGAIITALVGPLIMLVGLFANFMGQIGLFRSAILKAMGTLDIMTKAEWEAKVAAETATSTMVSQTRQAELLQAQLLALSESYGVAASAAMRYAGVAGAHAGGTTIVGGAAKPGKHMMGAEATTAASAVAAKNAEAVADAGAKSTKTWKSAAGAIALGGAGLAAAKSEGEGLSGLFDKILNGALTGAVVWSLLPTKMKAGTAEMAKMVTSGQMLKYTTSGIARGFTSLASGMSLAAGAWGAGAVAIYLAYKEGVEQREEAMQVQTEITKSTREWADHLGHVYKDYVRIKDAAEAVPEAPGVDRKDYMGVVERTDDLEENQPELYDKIKDLRELNDEAQAFNLAMNNAVESMLHRMPIAQVRDQVETMFYAFYEDAAKAEAATNKVLNSVRTLTAGQLQKKQLATFWDEFRSDIDSGLSENEMFALGEGQGYKIWDGLLAASKASPQAAKAYMDNLVKTFDSVGRDVFKEMQMDDMAGPLFEKLGITSAKKFQEAFRDSMDLSREEWAQKWGQTDDPMLGMQLSNEFQSVIAMNPKLQSIRETEQGIIKAIMTKAHLTGEYNSLLALSVGLINKELIASRSVAQIKKDYRAQLQANNDLVEQSMNPARAFTYEQKLQLLNQARAAMGLEETNRLADGFKKIAHDTTDELKKQTDETNNQTTAAERRNKAYNEFLKGGGFTDIARQGMEAATTAVGETMMDNLAAEEEQAMDTLEANGERRLAALDAEREARLKAYDVEQRRLDRQQERELQQFEDHWDDRMDAVNDAYDARAKRVEAAISQEEHAEEVRQRIFENEQERLQRAAELANTNIDFNMALNSGDLDEAAKIRNDLEATSASNDLDDAGEKSSRRSERTIKRLNNLLDKINSAKERRLAQLEDLEEAARRALEREQEREDRALEKERERFEERMDMQRELAENQIETSREAAEKEFEARRENLEKAIKALESYTGTSKKDLRDYMRDVAGRYDEFDKQLEDRGVKWGGIIGDALKENIRNAAQSLRSDINWAGIAKGAAADMVTGAFGMTLPEFKKWLGLSLNGGTGEGGGNGKVKGPGSNYHGPGGMPDPGQPPNQAGGSGSRFRHTGGIIDNSPGSRAGRTGPLKSDEVPFVGLKGESVLNRDATSRLGPSGVNALNRGQMDFGPSAQHKAKGIMGGIGAGRVSNNMGYTGLMGAFVNAIIRSGYQAGMSSALAMKAAQEAARSGTGVYSPGRPGVYGDDGMFFDREQLTNAAIIASVGAKHNMSKRDQWIGIMTAITESGLRNLNYGMGSSKGLFQQLVGGGWGTEAQITNPELAAAAFFGVAKHTNNPGLKDIKNRDSMTPWAAAQAVQRSGTSDGSNYRPFVDEAQDILEGLRFTPTGYSGSGDDYPLPGVKPWVDEAAEYVGSKFGIKTIYGLSPGSVPGSDHPKGLALDFMTNNAGGKKTGDALSKFVIANQKLLDVKYLIWRQRIWDAEHGWQPMEDRGSPTANHMDHVHVSFDANGDVDGLLQTGQGQDGVHGGGSPGPGTRGKSLPRRKPFTFGGEHDTGETFSGVDVSGNTGDDIFAVRPGKVTTSMDYYENGHLASYGRYIVIEHSNNQDASLYGHLSKRLVQKGDVVPAGYHIGEMGSTGNSSGSHLHLGSRMHHPQLYTHLSKGAETIRFDNTLANLHHGEAVLTEDISRKFKEGVNNFAEGGGQVYNNTNVHIHAAPGMDEDALVDKAVRAFRREAAKNRGRHINR